MNPSRRGKYIHVVKERGSFRHLPGEDESPGLLDQLALRAEAALSARSSVTGRLVKPQLGRNRNAVLAVPQATGLDAHRDDAPAVSAIRALTAWWNSPLTLTLFPWTQ